MPHIQIKNVPEDVHEALRRRAAAAGLTLSDYLLGEISRFSTGPTNAELLRRAATLSDRTLRHDDMLETLREAREGDAA